MSIRTTIAAASLALGSVIALSATAAQADTCNGSWEQAGPRIQKQCYYLPTVSDGRVTGVELKTNYRLNPLTPGAIIGGVNPQGSPRHHSGK